MTYIRTYGHEDDEGNWVRPEPKEGEEYTYQWNSEWADDPSKPVLKITKSSLGSFKWCNKQYEFSYMDRRPQEQTEAMTKGTVIHDSYEAFYNEVDIKKAEPMNYPDLVDYFTTLFPIDDYTDMTSDMAAYEAQRFIDFKKSGLLEEFLPVGNELMLDSTILIPRNTNPKRPLNRDYTVHLQGIIDRIYKSGDIYMPFEFKTGSWKDSKKTSMRREMAFYKLLMDTSPEWEGKVTKWGWYYPLSNHIYLEDVNTRSETAMMKAIADLIYSYELDEFKPSYFHKKCVWCSYQDLCPAAIDANLNMEVKSDKLEGWF